jgi:hypothetical protein
MPMQVWSSLTSVSRPVLGMIIVVACTAATLAPEPGSVPAPTPGDVTVATRGPRVAPPVPTGPNVYTIPSSIASNGTGDVGGAISAWLNSLPPGSIAKFTSANTEGYRHGISSPVATYRMSAGINVTVNNLTLWGYGTRIVLFGSGHPHENSAVRFWRNGKLTVRGFDILGPNAYGQYGINGEFAAGVNIAGDASVDVLDCWIHQTYGDGIFLAGWNHTDHVIPGYEWAYNLVEGVGRMGMTANQNDSGTAWIHHNIIRDSALYNLDGEDQRLGTDELINVLIEENDFGTFGYWPTTSWTPRSVSFVYDYWSPLPNMADVGPVVIRNNSFAGVHPATFDLMGSHVVIVDQRDVSSQFFGTYHDWTVTGNDFTNVPAAQRTVVYWARIHNTRNVTITGNTGLGTMAGRVTTTGSTGVTVSGNR